MSHRPADSNNPNAALVQRAIAGLSSRDVAVVTSCLHDEVVVELPFERDVPPLSKEALASFAGMLFATYEKFDLSLTHLYDLMDETTLIARYEGDCLGFDGVEYKNSYIAVFEFRDGLISNWREYDNPMISHAAQKAHAANRAAATSG